MEKVIEQYGVGLLQIIGGIGAFGILSTLIQPQGIVYVILMQYLAGISG